MKTILLTNPAPHHNPAYAIIITVVAVILSKGLRGV